MRNNKDMKETWFARLGVRLGDEFINLVLNHWPLIYWYASRLRLEEGSAPRDLDFLFLGACIGWYGKWLGTWWKGRKQKRQSN